MDYSRAVERLFSRQLRDWDEARLNYAGLAHVAVRSLELPGGSAIVLQHNPGRRRSSVASIDAAALSRRPCFLCREYQPAQQRALLWGNGYKIQVNPYPIFERHLTIASLSHEPQRLTDRLKDMLTLARDLPGFVIFYNGPRCGASAPDHAHFQAGSKGVLPLCDELLHTTTRLLDDGDEGFVGFVGTLGRSLFTIEAVTMRTALRYVHRLLELLPQDDGIGEPMAGVLCWWNTTDRVWHVVIVPRCKHRPACYGQGEGKLLISPATVEMAGLWVVPEQKDFESLTPNQVQAIYDELCVSRDSLSPILTAFTGMR